MRTTVKIEQLTDPNDKSHLYKLILDSYNNNDFNNLKFLMEQHNVRINVEDFIKKTKKEIDTSISGTAEEITLRVIAELVILGLNPSMFSLDDLMTAINFIPNRKDKLHWVRAALDRQSPFGSIIWNPETKYFSDNLEIYKRIYKSVRQYFHPNHYERIEANERIQNILNDFFEKHTVFDWENVLKILGENCINPNVKYFVSVKPGSSFNDRVERNLADVFIRTPEKGTSAITWIQLSRLLALGLDPNGDVEKKDSMLDAAARMASPDQAYLLLEYGASYRTSKSTLLDKLLVDKSKMMPDDVFKDVTGLVTLLNHQVEFKNLQGSKSAFPMIVTWLYKHTKVEDLTRRTLVNLKPFKKQLFAAIKEMNREDELKILKTVVEDNGEIKTSALGSVFWEGHTDPSRGNLKQMFDEYEKLKNPAAPTGLFARLFSGSSKASEVKKSEEEYSRTGPMLKSGSYSDEDM